MGRKSTKRGPGTRPKRSRRKQRTGSKDPAPRQLELIDNRKRERRPGYSFGGKKLGRPRKPGAAPRHEKRAGLNPRHPVHVTVRLCEGLPSIRNDAEREILETCIGISKDRFGGRITEYSIQSTHLHLIVEVDGSELATEAESAEAESAGTESTGEDPAPEGPSSKRSSSTERSENPSKEDLARLALTKSMKGLLGRAAKRLNKHWKRGGQVFERYHIVVADNPRQVWNLLNYVLNNGHKHGSCPVGIDPASSGRFFAGWDQALEPPGEPPEEWPVVAPRTWLGSQGWRRYGPIPIPSAA